MIGEDGLRRRWVRAAATSAWFGILLACISSAVWMVGCSGGPQDEIEPLDFSSPDIPGSDLVVAEVAGEPISAGYLQTKVRIQYPEMPQSGSDLGLQVREVLKRVIVEKCFNKLAEERGWDSDPELKRVMALSRAHFLTNVAVSNAVTKRATPSEEEIRAVYDENLSGYTIEPQAWWHQILLDSQSEAQSIRERLLAGERFEDLAKECSKDRASADQGGKMPTMVYYPSTGELGKIPELGRAVQEMEKGEISEPIQTEQGWRIIRLDAFRERKLRSFEEVHDQIASRMTQRVGSELYDIVLDSLKQTYKVVTFDEVLDQFYYLQMDDEELFAAAKRKTDPEIKLELYEQILERFPESKHYPEALFMVGFVSAEEAADTLRALDAFQHFLSEYPQHEMATSAKMMIRDLQGEKTILEDVRSSGQE